MNRASFSGDADLPRRLATQLREVCSSSVFARSFAPELSYGRHFAPPPLNSRQAAVLVLLYPRDDAWHLPLMLRPGHMVAHASQVSFPGGMIEGDETPEVCAVREFAEELGADTTSIELLGRLSPVYIFGSNFYVTPCVAWARDALRFAPNPHEVETLLEMPLQEIVAPAALQRHQRQRWGVSYLAPHFEFQSQRIWGATCIMLGQLRGLLTSLGET